MHHPFDDLWFSRKIRGWVYQFIFLGILLILAISIWHNVQMHLKAHGVTFGFGFLRDPAGFNIIMHLIDYNEQSSYAKAFWVGLLNTLLVSALGCLLATFLGLLIGLARISTHRALALLGKIYIETIRNIPLLLQIFFWYFVVLRAAPAPQQSFTLFNSIFINNRGIYLPTFTSSPVLSGLNFEGGLNLLPEFVALLIALSFYTASYIAEIIRLGIMAVPKEQKEAALALGLTTTQSFRYIVLPQALKTLLPPLTNQYINLTKNSSLAVAIAYPDLVSIFAGTVLNQTGHAVEIILITMAVYLFISITISACMLLYERSTQW